MAIKVQASTRHAAEHARTLLGLFSIGLRYLFYFTVPPVNGFRNTFFHFFHATFSYRAWIIFHKICRTTSTTIVFHFNGNINVKLEGDC